MPARKYTVSVVLSVVVAWGTVSGTAASGPDFVRGAGDRTQLTQLFLADQVPPFDLPAMGPTPCVDGFAGPYPCNRVDLLSFLPLAAIGGGSASGIWGWMDPQDSNEYALVGLTTGTAFVDVSDPENPVYLGHLPTHTGASPWRDIKVYQDNAYVVSEAVGHGMQVFDLTELRNVVSPPVTFAETVHYPVFGSAHNLAIDEATGFAYATGSDTCAGGPHIVDLQTLAAPVFAGCVAADGYTRDAHCVIYLGPDVEHQGKEICFNSNENALTVVDVTTKSNPVVISSTAYAGIGYLSQGWLTENHKYFMSSDELDEIDFGHDTRTRTWDVTDLDAPFVLRTHDAPSTAIDHNLFFRVKFAYQSNYRSGLRVLYMVYPDTMDAVEVGFFDLYPDDDEPRFNGAFSSYPFFPSGNVIVSGIEQGLYLLKTQIPTPLCEVATSQVVYGTGEQVVLSTLSYSNANGLTLPTRLRLQLRFGEAFTLDVIDIGATGGLAFPDGFKLDIGPVGLFDIPASLPRGVWSFRCSLEDPDTAILQSEDFAPFWVE